MPRIINLRNGRVKELQNSVRNKFTLENPRKNFHEKSLALTALSCKFALTAITFILWIKNIYIQENKRLKSVYNIF